MISKSSKIYIAGHRGMVGSAIVRRLQSAGYTNLITRTRQELNLLDQRATFDFLQAEKPDYISWVRMTSYVLKTTTAGAANDR